MTKQQLAQIKKFSRAYYKKTDQFHDWNHALLTAKYAFKLAEAYKDINYNILEASCYLHDIGRVIRDEGHNFASAKLAKPFLKKIGLTNEETNAILHAVSVHTLEEIDKAKTIEAKILFDADKIQILSVYGFIRVTFFVIYKRKMKLDKAVEFMWKYVKTVWENYIQTSVAKKMLEPEVKEIEKIVINFGKCKNGNLGMQ